MKKSFCLLILSITTPLWSMDQQEASAKIVTRSLEHAQQLLKEPQKSLAETPCATARDMIQNFIPQREYLKAFVKQLEHHTRDQFAFDQKIGDVAAQACADQKNIPLTLHTVRDIATRLFITWNRLQQDIALPQLQSISENILKLSAASDLLSKCMSEQQIANASNSQLVKSLQQGQELADLTQYEANRMQLILSRIQECAKKQPSTSTNDQAPAQSSLFPAVTATLLPISGGTTPQVAIQPAATLSNTSEQQASSSSRAELPESSPSDKVATLDNENPDDNENEHIPTLLSRGISRRVSLLIFSLLTATGISQVGLSAWQQVHRAQAIIPPHYGHSTQSDLLPYSLQAAQLQTPCPWHSRKKVE